MMITMESWGWGCWFGFQSIWFWCVLQQSKVCPLKSCCPHRRPVQDRRCKIPFNLWRHCWVYVIHPIYQPLTSRIFRRIHQPFNHWASLRMRTWVSSRKLCPAPACCSWEEPPGGPCSEPFGNSTVTLTHSALDDLPLPTRIFHGMLTCSVPFFSAPLPISHWKHLPEARRKALRVLKSYAASMGSKVRCDVPGYWISMGDSNGDILGIYQP